MSVDHTKLILDAEWYVVENDVIGGWAISTVNKPVSEIDPRSYGVYIVGEMLSLDTANHIVELHNRR
jgi:hypothetical protein